MVDGSLASREVGLIQLSAWASTKVVFECRSGCIPRFQQGLVRLYRGTNPPLQPVMEHECFVHVVELTLEIRGLA